MSEDGTTQELAWHRYECAEGIDVPQGATSGPCKAIDGPWKGTVHHVVVDPANAPRVGPDVESFVTNQSTARREPSWVQDKKGNAKGEADTDESRIVLLNHPLRIASGLHWVVMSQESNWSRTHWVVAGVLGVVLGLALMGPNVTQIGGALPGYFNDDWANGIYLHHQVHAALMSGRFDLSDPMQFHPIGYNPIHSNGGNILDMLVSGVSRMILPWPFWLSVGALLWIPLNILAFVPLGRRLWHRPTVILAAATLWAMFPPVLDQLAAGRLTQVAMVGLPLAVAGLLDVSEKGTRSSIRLAAVGLALTGLGYWFNALFLALLVPVFWLHGGRIRGWKPLGVDLLKVGALALTMVAPFLLVIFWPALTGGGMPGTHIDPTQMNVVFGDALKLTGGQVPGLANWLPFGMMVGAALTIRYGERRRLWGILALLCVVFSLGPGQRVGDTTYLMPYWVLWKGVPGLARMFHPDPWMLVGGLFLSIFAVEGLARKWPRAVWMLPIVVWIQLSVRGVVPLNTWAPDVPDHWRLLGEETDRGALIVFPVHRSQLAGAYQWSHQRALYGGMVEDQPWAQPKAWKDYEQYSAFLRSLRSLSYGTEVEIDVRAEDIERLRKDGFSRVVFDRFSWARMPWPVSYDPESRLTEALGAPLHRTEGGVVWDLKAR